MPIKTYKKSKDRAGGNTYAGEWRRRKPGEKGYIGSRAKTAQLKRAGESPSFLVGAVKNLTDFFGYLTVASTLQITITKVKELRLYKLKHKDEHLLAMLHLLNLEYMRNLYCLDIPQCLKVEFVNCKPGLAVIMAQDLKEGCFRGHKNYKKDVKRMTNKQYIRIKRRSFK